MGVEVCGHPDQPANSRIYAGVSGDHRRAGRRDRLLRAAETVLRARGLVKISFRAVCAEAGLSERYFYESFTDLDDLLRTLAGEYLAQVSTGVVAAINAAPRTAPDAIRAAVGSFVDQVREQPLLAQLLVEAAAHPVLNAIRREGLNAFIDLVVHYGIEHYGVPRSPRATRRARHAATMVTAGFAEVLVRWLSGDLTATRAELVDDTTDLFLATVEHVAAATAARASKS